MTLKKPLTEAKTSPEKEKTKPMFGKDLRDQVPKKLFNSMIRHEYFKKYISHPFNTPIFTHAVDNNGFHHIEAAHLENIADKDPKTLKYKVHFVGTESKVIQAAKYHKHGEKTDSHDHDAWRFIHSKQAK